MPTFLFHDLVFGPIKSRRLGHSLGINLLPTTCKYCNFNCIYCECGVNKSGEKIILPTRNEIKQALKQKLADLSTNNQEVDSITFAGNGEPTLHPEFEGIIEDTIQIRNQYFAKAKISVLSNATMIKRTQIVEALKLVDMAILKIDSAIETTAKAMNRPTGQYSINETVNLLKAFNGKFILQTMFLEGTVNGIHINNMTPTELKAWLNIVDEIKPSSVMIYTIARDTPEKDLRKASHNELEYIKNEIIKLGISVQVSE